MRVFKVTFNFEEKGLGPISVQGAEGETLLDLALENNVELHHNCGGVCACTTCHVYIDAGMGLLPEMSEREEDYIDRAINPKLNSRLACQCEIKGDVILTIPDQSLMLGH